MRSDHASLKMTAGAATGARRSGMRFRRLAFWRDQRGVSALEFSLFAPIVVIGFLSVVDLAFIAQQRMAIDHVLRTGADEAMLDMTADENAPEVMKVMNLVAIGNFAVGSTSAVNGKPYLTLSATRSCECPGSIGTSHSCSSACTTATGPVQPLAFYEITAESKSLNIFLPQITFTPRLQVQVR